MPMTDIHHKRLSVTAIDFGDDHFALRPAPEEPDASLEDAIRRWGVLHPPIVIERGQGRYAIVCGRKRLLAARRALGATPCACLVAPATLPGLEVLALAVTESLMDGTLGAAQKAIAIRKAAAMAPLEEVADRLPPLWGEAPREFVVQRHLAIAALEPPILQGLHDGSITDKTAAALTGFSFRDRLALYDIIQGLSLSVSNQRRLLHYCLDVSKRRGVTVHSLLAADDIAAILAGEQPNHRKTARLMEVLAELHAPALTDASRRFRDFADSLALPSWAAVSHTPAFENDQVTLHLTMDGQEQAARLWQEICKITSNR